MKIVEKPPRNSAGFCGGDQGLTGLWSQGKKKKKKKVYYRVHNCKYQINLITC
jgi:hypothetical protein